MQIRVARADDPLDERHLRAQPARRRRPQPPATVAAWERSLFTDAERAARAWVWRTRHVARRNIRADSPRRPPCSFGLRPSELRRHAAALLAQGWAPAELLERLDIPAAVVTALLEERRNRRTR